MAANSKTPSSLRTHWSRLLGTVHPDDQIIFETQAHSFNLEFPPPAFTGDIDHAPIVVLMANGGYDPVKTPSEFKTSEEVFDHHEFLIGGGSVLPRSLSAYYRNGAFGSMIEDGSVVLVNAVPYRSTALSKEPDNKAVAQQLPSLAVHRRWLRDELLPQARAGQRYVLAHRVGWWDISPSDELGPHVVFSDSRRAEPNRKSPDRDKIEKAKVWLDQLYNAYGEHKSERNNLAAFFAQRFQRWNIRLSKSAIALGLSGDLYANGWFIQYLFGEENGRQYLDYYASHRMMAGDEHTRLYSNGSRTQLPSIDPFLRVSDDPLVNMAYQDEHYRRNHEIGRLLRDKGFNS